jgi:hypothetical protein
MRAPRHGISKLNDAAAIEEASRHLRRLFVDSISWSEGADTSSPKKKFGASMGLVEGALAEAECALKASSASLNEAMKCALNKRAKNAIDSAMDAIANAIPFIELARKAAIPELRRARPAIGRWGQHGDLNASRNQTIAETVASIGKQFGLSQEQASSIVSEALKSLVLEHRRVFRSLTKERAADPEWIPADPAWIDQCLKFVDRLRLSEDSVEDIAKKYRT